MQHGKINVNLLVIFANKTRKRTNDYDYKSYGLPKST